MKYLIFLSLSFNLFAQSKLLLFEDDNFNPATYDNHTIALYDGDLGLTTSTWEDQIASYDFTLVNTPTVVDNAINGHDALRFNGTDEDGSTASMSLNQPCTYYLVVKQITWTANDYIIGGTAGAFATSINQFTLTPRLQFASTVSLTNDNFTVDTYKILTAVGNGANSILQTNQTAASTGDIGTTSPTGIIIGDRPSGSRNGNIEYAYIIIRNQADDLATRTKFQNFLAKRFGITL